MRHRIRTSDAGKELEPVSAFQCHMHTCVIIYCELGLTEHQNVNMYVNYIYVHACIHTFTCMYMMLGIKTVHFVYII